MSGYQHLQNYKGSLYGKLDYSGIEYDYEVPDNLVISSPGGVSGIHHHYTKGIYSDASSTQDIHAGNGRADGYPYGEYGNLYQVGQSATRYMGDFVEPADMSPDRGTGYTQNQGEPHKEYFRYIDPSTGVLTPARGPPQGEMDRRRTSMGDMELISPDQHPSPLSLSPRATEGTTPIPDVITVGQGPVNIIDVLKIMGVFTVGYMALNFWVKGGEDFINTRFYGGKVMDWKQYLIVAFIFTVALLAFAYIFGIPFISIEKI
jgi:hypothetical protein